MHPVSEDISTYGREWDIEIDPQDFPLNTIPEVCSERLALHHPLPFDEDHRIEFKAASFLTHFPAFNMGFEQPNDYFLYNSPSARWKKQPKAPIPETVAEARTSKYSTSPQVTLRENAQRMLQDDAYRRDRERAEMSFHTLIQQVAPSFPDGRWLSKRIPPFFESLLLENVVAILNSPRCKDGVLYFGIEDADGRVTGFPLTYRQRRCVLYLSARVMLTIYPPLKKGDIDITFPQVCSDVELKRPLENHCVVKVSIHPKEGDAAVPLYIHPRISKDANGRCSFNPLIPAAPVRRLGSKVKLSVEQIRQHISNAGALEDYSPFV